MKTHTLKSKAALIAALLAVISQSQILAVGPRNTPTAAQTAENTRASAQSSIPKRAVVAAMPDQEFNEWLAKQISEDANSILAISEAQYLELMVNRIKHDAVEQIIDDVEGWTKSTPEAQLIRLYKRQGLIIKNLMLDPMEKRLATAVPNSDFAKIIQNAIKVAKTMAYTKLEELTKMLEAHKACPDWNKGKPHILAGKLRTLLKKIISPDTLTTLEKELGEILVLVKRSGNSDLVVKELVELQKLIAEIKSKAATTQSKINGIELLTIIGQKERQL